MSSEILYLKLKFINSNKIYLDHLSAKSVKVLPTHSDVKFSCRNYNTDSNMS